MTAGADWRPSILPLPLIVTRRAETLQGLGEATGALSPAKMGHKRTRRNRAQTNVRKNQKDNAKTDGENPARLFGQGYFCALIG